MSTKGKKAVTNKTPTTKPTYKWFADRKVKPGDLDYVCYGSEKETLYLPKIKALISKDLSEPYSIYVFRYFLYQWGELCFMVIPPHNINTSYNVC